MSEVARPPRAVLDTDVIFSRVLYELFGRLAIEHEVLSLIWSDELGALAMGVDLSSLTSDADDEHVCALALAGGANLLLTFDHGYDRAALKAHGVEVAEPDAFLSGLLDEHRDPGCCVGRWPLSGRTGRRAGSGARPAVRGRTSGPARGLRARHSSGTRSRRVPKPT